MFKKKKKDDPIKAKAVATGGGAVVGGFMLIALPFTAHHEGKRLQAYLDVGGVPTICYGETLNVKMGDIATDEECKAMFKVRLAWFGAMVKSLTNYPMSDKTHAAMTSFTYNIGVNGYRRSKTRMLYNKGESEEACHAMMGWYIAGGKNCFDRSNNCYGLIARRMAERDLCLSGLPDKEV